MNQSETESSRRNTPRGRPKQNSLEPARDKIVGAARALLRERPIIALQRQEFAMAAGVTPALVTYHFPKQRDLIDAAAKPILDSYLRQIRDALSSSDDTSQKLRAIVLLSLKCNKNDAYLIDKYIFNLDKRSNKSISILYDLSAELVSFTVSCCEQGYFRSLPPDVIRSVLWGICKMVAQSNSLKELISEGISESRNFSDCQADMIVDMLTYGIIKK